VPGPPYLGLPELPRARWRLELPPMRRLVRDERGIPTGADEAFRLTCIVFLGGDPLFRVGAPSHCAGYGLDGDAPTAPP
jgi:hypothetical protein